MEEYLCKIRSLITTDNIAFLSVIITVFIYVFSRRAEMRYKKLDDKKLQYIKILALFEKSFTGIEMDKEGTAIITSEFKAEFFDAGSSLLLYGSKNLYKQYLFFREFTSNPLIKQCKYYDDNLIIYVVADILTTMRKEVGLRYFSNIHNNEALGFFVNDFANNPIVKERAIKAKFQIRMIKFELNIIDHQRFILCKRIYASIIRPFIGALRIIIKHAIKIPLGRLLMKLFPKTYAQWLNDR